MMSSSCICVKFVAEISNMFVVLIKLPTLALVITECIFSILWISDTEYNIFDYRKYKVIDIVIKDLRVQNRRSQVQSVS